MVLSEAGGVGLIQYCIENLTIHPRVPARQWEIMTECYLRLGHKIRELKVCANERKNSHHCWPNNVETSCMRLHGAKRLITFKLCATEQLPKTRNNMQQGVQTDATCSIQQFWEFSCCPPILRPFAQGFSKQQRRPQLRTRYLKSEFRLLQTLSRLFC